MRAILLGMFLLLLSLTQSSNVWADYSVRYNVEVKAEAEAICSSYLRPDTGCISCQQSPSGECLTAMGECVQSFSRAIWNDLQSACQPRAVDVVLCTAQFAYFAVVEDVKTTLSALAESPKVLVQRACRQAVLAPTDPTPVANPPLQVPENVLNARGTPQDSNAPAAAVGGDQAPPAAEPGPAAPTAGGCALSLVHLDKVP